MQKSKIKMQNLRRSLSFVLPFAFCLLTFPSLGDDAVTLPLQGYYHPGKYMPIHVAISPNPGDSEVRLVSPGAVGTFIVFEGGRIDATVPWLPMDARARGVAWLVPPRAA